MNYPDREGEAPTKMIIEPKASDVGIVLLGSFNPAIVGPDWLVVNQVVGKEAGSSRDIVVISPDLTQFRVAAFNFQVTSQRFQILFESIPFIELQDAACKIFGELLPHTPSRQAAHLNLSAIEFYSCHFRNGKER